ncbi:MAG: ABC transporter ATP-binding protein [Clostridia bacterium]|nr:ABC transporter ATP-binding protein [Clostridia bacterium]
MIKVLRYLKQIKSDIILSLVFVVLSQLSSLSLPLLMSLIINNGIANADLQFIKNIGAIMAAISALHVVLSVFNSYYTSKTSAGYGKILREDLFLKVESLSQIDIEKIGTPSLITRCTSDVKVMQDFILMSLRIIISSPIMLIGGTIMAVILNPKLALTILAVFPIIGIIVAIVLKTVIPIFKKRQKMTDEVNRFLRQKLSGIRVIKAFNTINKEDDIFSEKNQRLSFLVLKLQRIMSVLIPVCIVLVVVALDTIIFIATKNIDTLSDPVKIQNTVGDLQAFVIYMIMIVAAVTMSAAMFVIVPRANISAKRIKEILELESQIKDPEVAKDIDNSQKGKVEFENVSFSYEDGENNVLSNISFVAEIGKTTAIIGSTGSGKTTVANLLCRFCDVKEGRVLFGGVDVRELKQKELLSKISYIPQKPVLFSGSIRENLLYGDENASEEKLKKALDISQSSEFVFALENGMESFISQNGTNLSGGQKQRLSIARALVKDADVYIFDDSFSALDFKTDSLLRKALKENLSATVIIVAQRVGTIMNADKIIVLENGKIVGMGKHAQLMEDCAVYREIALSQLSSKEVLQ